MQSIMIYGDNDAYHRNHVMTLSSIRVWIIDMFVSAVWQTLATYDISCVVLISRYTACTTATNPINIVTRQCDTAVVGGIAY